MLKAKWIATKRQLNLITVLFFMTACFGTVTAATTPPVATNPKATIAPVTQSYATVTTSAATLPMQNLQHKSYTLTEISGADGFMLRGANSTRVLFLPVLQNWLIDSITIHFNMFSAALIETSNTVTAYINDSPIGSMQLNGHLNTNVPWDITVPANLIKGNVVNLTVTNMVNDYGFSCYNLSNPKYWIFITGGSTVTYHYVTQNYFPDLSKFPYPFINDPSIQQDSVIFVFPDTASLADDTAAFNVTNALLQFSTWRGIKITASTVSLLTDEQKKNNNLIYIGTNSELKLAATTIPWPLTVNNEISDKNGQKIADETGVLMMAASPWNPTKGILAVTGNTEEALIKAANILRDKNFENSILFHEYGLITQPPSAMNFHPSWTETTLADLNFPNQVVYGNGQNAINYDINLPEDKIVSGIDLSVDYSISPFLSATDNSYLMLRVNDVPMAGITLNVGDTKIKKWNIHIDGKDLKPGLNRMAFIFNLNMKNRYCKPEDSSLAWGSIFSSSSLVLTLDSGKVFLKFKLLKSTPNGLLVSIPENNPFFKSPAFGQQVIDLAQSMPLVSDVNFISNQALTPENARNKDVIYIGNIDDNPSLVSLRSLIPFYYVDNTITIDPTLKPYLAISHENPVNINELITSPFNPDRMLMLILSNNPDGYQAGISLYTDPKKSALINGNATLSYLNGTFTSVQSDQIALKVNHRHIAKMVILYSLLTLLFGGLFSWYGLKLYRRVKAYFTRQP